MERADELKELILRFYDAVTNGDIDFIERLVSRQAGVLAIGTDPGEWWEGYDRIVQTWRAQFQELGGGLQVVGANPQVHQAGPVGWFADRPIWRLPDGTEIPTRVTAVFHREDGEWKAVQLHNSIGASNEEVVGKELPT